MAEPLFNNLELAAETLNRLEKHLEANEVDLATPIRAGRWLRIDDRNEEIAAEDGPDAEKAVQASRAMARGHHPPPFVMPEIS